ncbi:MAG: hypothetical protein HOD40_08490 [Chloroflexi bacterium]|nr:hypothetical protein [Chloroflexota bacterium]
MSNKRLGCLTVNALISFLLSIFVVAIVFVISGKAMFSPGELSDASRSQPINGVSSHDEIKEICGECHAVPYSDRTMTELCIECHLTALDDFDNEDHAHSSMVYEYQTIECFYCHIDHKGKDAKTTFFPSGVYVDHTRTGFTLDAHNQADVDCTGCHIDNFSSFKVSICEDCHQNENPILMADHVLIFDYDCLACHDGVETYGKSFDHNEVEFQLIGSHAGLECESCHQDQNTISEIKNTSQECIDCHEKDDVHLGTFDTNCAECHTPVIWIEAEFDHMSTGWELEGKHQNLECLDCHVDRTYLGASSDCFSCHEEEDEHMGQFGQSCGTCHIPEDWTISIFTHLLPIAINCESCHQVDAPDPHYKGQCSACHITDAWTPATFDHLVAEANNCSECHFSNAPVPHYNGQCSACHTVDAWLPASFDHAVAGAYICTNCHTPDKPINHYGGQCSACPSTAYWSPANFNHTAAGATNCQECHLNSRPANHFSGQCSDCHSTEAWKPASFNHTFPLDHEGANSDCSLCHTGGNYQSYSCDACHDSGEMADKHSDIPNYGNCMDCHADGQKEDDD